MIELYSYYRSSAAYRVRIALNYKGIKYQQKTINLIKGAGEQHQAEYKAINPQGLVPALVHEDQVITQSLAILEYLEEAFQMPHLLPETSEARAYVRSISQIISCDIHPLNNLRVLTFLTEVLDISQENKDRWYANWINKGFETIEYMLQKRHTGRFCYSEQPTMADMCLIPQVYNALRFKVSLKLYPHIVKIYEHCMTLPYFDEAKPESQPDAV